MVSSASRSLYLRGKFPGYLPETGWGPIAGTNMTELPSFPPPGTKSSMETFTMVIFKIVVYWIVSNVVDLYHRF
jgi:hypothetical protein